MDKNTIFAFTRNGMGHGPQELQTLLVQKFLQLNLENSTLPAKMLFYTDGVKLACTGSSAIDWLKKYEAQGVELVLCSTCLQFYNLADQVQVGVAGSMADIIQSLDQAAKVISL